MTAKEKVLAAEPRARHWGNTEGLYVIGFKDGDRFVQLGQLQESIEAAWQNAAESLPAEREQDDSGHFIECSKCQSSTNLTYYLMDDASRDVRERWNRRVK